MSGILRRTVKMGRGADGYLRFSPWRQVVTGQGVMWEPRSDLVPRDGFTDYDNADAMNMVDDVDVYDPMAADKWGEKTIGGHVVPLGFVTSY